MVNSFIVVEMTAKQGKNSIIIGLILLIVIEVIDYLINKRGDRR